MKAAQSRRKSGVSVLGMFVLSWAQAMISSEDVIGVSVCIPGLLGGVSHISNIDLPKRQMLVPGSPAASVGPGDRQQGEMGKDVSTNPAGAFDRLRPKVCVCFIFLLRLSGVKP